MTPRSTSPTDDTVLDAAADAFAQSGFEGARVDAIAAAAGVNKATLYYRIGDKQALYGAVVARLLGGMAEEMERETAEADDPREQLRRFVRVFARNAGSVRHGAPIILREVASGGAHLDEAALGHMAAITGLLHHIVARGVERGLFRPVNPFTTHMLIAGSLVFLAANAPIRRRIAERHSADLAESLLLDPERATEQVCDLVLAALRPETGGMVP